MIHSHRGLALVLGAALLPALLTGCSGGGASKAIDLYNVGDYDQALAVAGKEAATQSGLKRDRSLLTAGLAAAALDQPADAKRFLKPLCNHPDGDISGRANAGLGLLAQQHNEHEEAASLLSAAALRLRGDDAAQAALQAGDSLATLARMDSANLKYKDAARLAQSPDLKRMILARQDMGPFTVQVGSFTQRANANRAVNEVQAASAQAGFGSPRIVIGRNAQGKVLYQVRVGEFQSRQDAVAARGRIGGKGVVVSVGVRGS